jgi:hypothetical protein
MGIAELILGGQILFFGICAVIIIYLIVKRLNQKEDFEKRDN